MTDSELTKREGQKLLRLAREVIESKFNGEKPGMPEEEVFSKEKGIFATLKKGGELRGCVGLPYPTLPLKKAVRKAARSAAFYDPRFPPVSEEELDDISIEISTLTLPKECKPEEIEKGKDGLICNYQGQSGLLLPQVAIDHSMSREEFLEAVCKKAGLPKDMWEEPDCKLWKFQCQVFSEDGDEK